MNISACNSGHYKIILVKGSHSAPLSSPVNARSGLSCLTITLMSPILPSPFNQSLEMGIQLNIPARFTPGTPSASSTYHKIRSEVWKFLWLKLWTKSQTSIYSRKDLRKSSWSLNQANLPLFAYFLSCTWWPLSDNLRVVLLTELIMPNLKNNKFTELHKQQCKKIKN